jgi:outer membrane protein OmpA-like peptidoglycan-associated protein
LKEIFIKIRTNGTPVLKGISASKPIGFGSGSAKLDASDLKLIAAVAKKYAGQKGSLVVVGFTQRGTQSTVASKKLALARAKAVSNALAKVGGIETVGYVGFGVRNKLNPTSSDNRVAIRWIPAS